MTLSRALRFALAALLLAPSAAVAQVVTRNVQLLAHFNDYPPVQFSPSRPSASSFSSTAITSQPEALS